MSNSQLTKSLIEFVVKGPKSEGTLIRDPNRTDLVLTYLDFLIDKSYRNGYSSCPLILKRSEFEFILSLPITETTDFTRYKTNNMPMSMVWRLSQAMQMSSRSLLFLSKLVENQLSTIMESEKSKYFKSKLFCHGISNQKSSRFIKIMYYLDNEVFITTQSLVVWPSRGRQTKL